MNKYISFRKLTEHKKQLIAEYKNLKEAKKMEELKALNLERDRSKDEKEKQEKKRLQ